MVLKFYSGTLHGKLRSQTYLAFLESPVKNDWRFSRVFIHLSIPPYWAFQNSGNLRTCGSLVSRHILNITSINTTPRTPRNHNTMHFSRSAVFWYRSHIACSTAESEKCWKAKYKRRRFRKAKTYQEKWEHECLCYVDCLFMTSLVAIYTALERLQWNTPWPRSHGYSGEHIIPNFVPWGFVAYRWAEKLWE